MKKKVAILIENIFDDEEFIYPYHRLLEDFDVDVIGSEADESYHSKNNFTFKSDKASKDVSADDYEAIFIPGGFSPDYMRRNEYTVKLVSDFDKAKKPIAAVCHAGSMLVSAVDIKGKTVTSHYAIRKDIENAGAKWIDEGNVRDGHILTGRNPKDLHLMLVDFKKMINGEI